MKPAGFEPPAASVRWAMMSLAALHLACGSPAPPAPRAAGEARGGYSPAPLDALLRKHVRDGLVDYRALKADPDLSPTLKLFEATDPGRLPGRSERLAFWINAYNLLALKGVVDSYPVRSIREIGILGRFTFFRGMRFHMGGRDCTLDTIAHKILRPEFHEPRVHFAIVSASLGSPRLRSSAFNAEDLEDELDAAAREFVSDPAKVRLDRAQGVLHLSPLFDWFGEDFERAAGSRAAFVRRYLPPADAEFLGRGGVTIRYLDFDWSLNDRNPIRPE